jgi:tetratricopeptide (TPR) repeat protein
MFAFLPVKPFAHAIMCGLVGKCDSGKLMQDQTAMITRLLKQQEIKRAEMLIAKRLRSTIPQDERLDLLYYRAQARLAGGRPDDAITDLQTLSQDAAERLMQPGYIELLGDSYFSRYEQAVVGFADRNDVLKAKDCYMEIITNHPQYENLGWAYYQLGRLCLVDNDSDLAQDHFHNALFAPSTVEALTAFCYERLGFVVFYEHRAFDKALALLDKAVHTYPAHAKRQWLAQVYILRSRVLQGMKENEKAVEIANKALQIASHNNGEDKAALAEALLAFGELLSALGIRHTDTIKYLQQFLQVSKRPLGIDVTWSRVHEMLGDAYFQVGQFSEAINAYQATLSYNPYHPWALSLHYRIAHSYYLLNDYEQSISTIQAMLDLAQREGESIDDYHVYDVLASAQFAIHHYSAAAESYRHALALAPPHAENIAQIKTYYEYAQKLS